jgi:hypothetical protein
MAVHGWSRRVLLDLEVRLLPRELTVLRHVVSEEREAVLEVRRLAHRLLVLIQCLAGTSGTPEHALLHEPQDDAVQV